MSYLEEIPTEETGPEIIPATFSSQDELRLLVGRWLFEREVRDEMEEDHGPDEPIDASLMRECARTYMDTFCAAGGCTEVTDEEQLSPLVQSVGGRESALGLALIELEQERKHGSQ